MSTEDQLTQAIDVVARRFIIDAADKAITLGEHDHEEYPDIGEYDFGRVCDRAQELLADERQRDEAGYKVAYLYLAQRANDEDEEAV